MNVRTRMVFLNSQFLHHPKPSVKWLHRQTKDISRSGPTTAVASRNPQRRNPSNPPCDSGCHPPPLLSHLPVSDHTKGCRRRNPFQCPPPILKRKTAALLSLCISRKCEMFSLPPAILVQTTLPRSKGPEHAIIHSKRCPHKHTWSPSQPITCSE